MNWQYFWGIIGFVAFGGMTFVFGWMAGHPSGRKKGFYEGWEDGCDYTEKRMTEEFNNAFPGPFRARLQDSNRKSMPRPDSAGAIRTHKAVVRGDFRLPSNKPAPNPLPPDPTKFNINPAGDE
jgi:hypothetical protein